MVELRPLIDRSNIEEAYRRFREFVQVHRGTDDVREATETLCEYLGFDSRSRKLFVALSATIADADLIDRSSFLLGGLLALLAADDATEPVADDSIIAYAKPTE
jgi:hypothetical protein